MQKAVVVVELGFKNPSIHISSFRARSAILTTLFLGRGSLAASVHIISPLTDSCSS